MKQAPPERFYDWDAEVAWDYDGVVSTWRLGRDGETCYLKVRRPGSAPYSLADEKVRLAWLGDHVRVPEVLDYGIDGETEWLLLAELPGRDATHPDLKADPRSLVPLLARGLRDFHERLDPQGCPFDFTLDTALSHVRQRLRAGTFHGKYEFHEEHRHVPPEEQVRLLEATKPTSEDLVVCHGDYCFPNVMIDEGRIVGYLDVGELGVADRWWDVAVGAWSCTWNVGPGYEDLFYESYGIDPDPNRIAFFRMLYGLAS